MRNFNTENLLHSETLGFDLSALEQGTPNWHRSRAGVISASKAHYLLMGRTTLGRQTYMNELVASIVTGLLPEDRRSRCASPWERPSVHDPGRQRDQNQWRNRCPGSGDDAVHLVRD